MPHVVRARANLPPSHTSLPRRIVRVLHATEEIVHIESHKAVEAARHESDELRAELAAAKEELARVRAQAAVQAWGAPSPTAAAAAAAVGRRSGAGSGGSDSGGDAAADGPLIVDGAARVCGGSASASATAHACEPTATWQQQEQQQQPLLPPGAEVPAAAAVVVAEGAGPRPAQRKAHRNVHASSQHRPDG